MTRANAKTCRLWRKWPFRLTFPPSCKHPNESRASHRASCLTRAAQLVIGPPARKNHPPATKELAGMFEPIDKAADGGNKEETQRLHEKMKSLIADLKKHSAHAKKGEHHDE